MYRIKQITRVGKRASARSSSQTVRKTRPEQGHDIEGVQGHENDGQPAVEDKGQDVLVGLMAGVFIAREYGTPGDDVGHGLGIGAAVGQCKLVFEAGDLFIGRGQFFRIGSIGKADVYRQCAPAVLRLENSRRTCVAMDELTLKILRRAVNAQSFAKDILEMPADLTQQTIGSVLRQAQGLQRAVQSKQSVVSPLRLAGVHGLALDGDGPPIGETRGGLAGHQIFHIAALHIPQAEALWVRLL